MKTKSLNLMAALLVGAAFCWTTPSRAQTAVVSGEVANDNANVINYKTATGDLLTIVVAGEDKLTGDYQVGHNGQIQFPLLDEISVVGLTPPEIANRLKEGLEKDYLVHAYVRVFVKTFRMHVVTVIGEVQHPTAVEFTGDKTMTVMEAIGRAGGWTKTAKQSKIYITRGKKKIIFDYRAYKDNPAKYEVSPILEDGDVIIVEESAI